MWDSTVYETLLAINSNDKLKTLVVIAICNRQWTVLLLELLKNSKVKQ